jgi:hypothetical protein
MTGASGSFLPAFSIFWLLGAILLAGAGWKFYKFKIVRGIILVLLALVAFQIPGTISGPKLEKGLLAAPSYVAEKGSNLLVTGTTKSPADIAAANKAAAEARAAEAKATEAERLLEAKVAGTERAAYDAEVAKNLPLTKAAFTTKTIGTFEPFIVKSGTMLGPINSYKGTCPFWSKSGFGMIEIYTRPDTTSKPVLAELDDNYSIKKKGHQGATAQLFFKAVQGDIQIEFERRVNGTCK